MNKVILMGRLTRDPEIRYSQNDSSMRVARFTLAVDRRFKRDNEATADFIGCVAFGRTAEFFERFIHQGTKVCVEGRIQTGSFTRQDGTKAYTTDVVVENAEFAESKAASGGAQGGQPYQQGGASQPYQQSSMAQPYQQGGAPQPYQQSSMAQPYQQSSTPQQYQQSSPSQQFQQDSAAPVNNNGFGSQTQGGDNFPPQAESHAGFYEQSAPVQDAADEGFMQIPDSLEDEGLPFN